MVLITLATIWSSVYTIAIPDLVSHYPTFAWSLLQHVYDRTFSDSVQQLLGIFFTFVL